jgi:hypothetical protein
VITIGHDAGARRIKACREDARLAARPADHRRKLEARSANELDERASDRVAMRRDGEVRVGLVLEWRLRAQILDPTEPVLRAARPIAHAFAVSMRLAKARRLSVVGGVS